MPCTTGGLQRKKYEKQKKESPPSLKKRFCLSYTFAYAWDRARLESQNGEPPNPKGGRGKTQKAEKGKNKERPDWPFGGCPQKTRPHPPAIGPQGWTLHRKEILPKKTGKKRRERN